VFNPDRKDTNWGKQTALVVVVASEALAHSRLRFPTEFFVPPFPQRRGRTFDCPKMFGDLAIG
jgi:hypothetical protein